MSLRIAACLGILVALGTTPLAAGPAHVLGRAAVIDGDTIEVHGERIRLTGIDAPESA